MSSRKDLQLNKLSLGSRISLITSAQYRYEGILAAINSIEGTLTLQNVRFWGSENRTPIGERKGPATGSVFDSITFWMSNVIHLHVYHEGTDNADLGDRAVVKASSNLAVTSTPPSGDSNTRLQRSRNRKQKNTWPKKDQPQINSPGEESMIGKRRIRVTNSPTQTTIKVSRPGISRSVGRTLVSYPRRGTGRFPGPHAYLTMPATSFVSPSNMRRRGLRVYRQGIPNGGAQMNDGNFVINDYMHSRRGGRKSVNNDGGSIIPDLGQRFNAAPNDVRPGGVFVYVPAEMAATAYHQQTPHLGPGGHMMGGSMVLGHGPGNRMGGRRRSVRRGGLNLRHNIKEVEIDCSTPYDFETANAELEAELAKLSISSDEDSDALSTPAVTDLGGQGVVSSTSTSTGNGDTLRIKEVTRSSEEVNSSLSPTVDMRTTVPDSINGDLNGASGDTSTSVVTSSRVTGYTSGESSATQTIQLGKGEYYSREKSFFDRISRSESGLHNTTGISMAGNTNKQQTGGVTTSGKPRARFATVSSATSGGNTTGENAGVPFSGATGSGGQNSDRDSIGMSLGFSARRERQLNLETFGALAARPFSFGARYNNHYYQQSNHQFHNFIYRKQHFGTSVPNSFSSDAHVQQQQQQQNTTRPLGQVVGKANSSVSVASPAAAPAHDLLVTATA